MLSLLKKIHDDIDAIKEVATIDSPVAKDEEVIGQITDLELKKLFTLRSILINSYKKDNDLLVEEAGKLGRSHKHDDNCPICSKVEALQLKNKLMEVLGEIFWHCVHLSLDTKNLKKALSSSTGAVGVRAGWKIVLMPKEESNIRVIGVGRFPFQFFCLKF